MSIERGAIVFIGNGCESFGLYDKVHWTDAFGLFLGYQVKAGYDAVLVLGRTRYGRASYRAIYGQIVAVKHAKLVLWIPGKQVNDSKSSSSSSSSSYGFVHDELNKAIHEIRLRGAWAMYGLSELLHMGVALNYFRVHGGNRPTNINRETLQLYGGIHETAEWIANHVHPSALATFDTIRPSLPGRNGVPASTWRLTVRLANVRVAYMQVLGVLQSKDETFTLPAHAEAVNDFDRVHDGHRDFKEATLPLEGTHFENEDELSSGSNQKN